MDRVARYIDKLGRRLGVDRPIAYAVMARFWSVAAAPITMLVIASRFSRELQGYYFTFGSLLALQVFMEMGFGQVIMQFSSHEWSRLEIGENGEICGDLDSLARLASIGRFALRWYIVAGTASALVLSIVGWVFFSHSKQVAISWQAPWLSLAVLTGVSVTLLPLWSLIEGCNQLDRLYWYRFISGILQSLAVWSAALVGAGLWAPVAGSLVSCLWALAFLYKHFRKFLRSLHATRSTMRINWRTEMLPMQWRIALSWLSGYFCFSLFTPLTFHYQGPIVGGQMGMTWTLVGGLNSVALAWLYTKAPRCGMLVAAKNYVELERLLLRSGLAAVTVALLGAMGIEGTLYLLGYVKPALAARLLAPRVTAIFLAATVLMQLAIPQGIFLRAHKVEPLMSVSVVSAILIAGFSFLVCPRYGAEGVAWVYLGVSSLVMLPIDTVIFQYWRRKWKQEAADIALADRDLLSVR